MIAETYHSIVVSVCSITTRPRSRRNDGFYPAHTHAYGLYDKIGQPQQEQRKGIYSMGYTKESYYFNG